MNLPVLLSPAAGREFVEAAAWYEQQARRGDVFIGCVQEVLDLIGRQPELHAVIYRALRRARVQRFPYSVFYRVLPDRVEVIAVFHGRRDPRIWQSRT